MLTIGVIGRPNVGKSTLFNKIAGRRISIVDDMPGVTRDRVEVHVDWDGKRFRLVDTAGFDLKEDVMKKEMHAQIESAMKEADLFVVVVDGMEGIHPLDEMVVDTLRKRNKPYIVAVNKIDNESREIYVPEFYGLGVSELHPISATHGRNVDELLDVIVTHVPEEDIEEELYAGRIKIAVIGRPNVGKSSIINQWLGEERLIVTPVAGTTRDAVDTFFEYGDRKYVLIDTAGIRKKSVMFRDRIEKYGYYRSMDAIERCDVAVALVDIAEGLTERDVKVIATAWEIGKPVVVVLNKWDAVEKAPDTAKKIMKEIEFKLQFLSGTPMIFASALTGKNVTKVFSAVNELYEAASVRIPTSELNRLLEDAQARHQPPVIHNRRLKFYFITQVTVLPPEFVVFVNFPEAVHFSYARFIVNMIREYFGFKGVPLKIHFRKRGEKRAAKSAVKHGLDSFVDNDPRAGKVVEPDFEDEYDDDFDDGFDEEFDADFDEGDD